jgi:hypothetical protein
MKPAEHDEFDFSQLPSPLSLKPLAQEYPQLPLPASIKPFMQGEEDDAQLLGSPPFNLKFIEHGLDD